MRTAEQLEDLAAYTRAYNELARAEQQVQIAQTKLDRACAAYYCGRADAATVAAAESCLSDATAHARYLGAATRHLRLFT